MEYSVTQIGKDAFSSNAELQRVVIPSTVESIGNDAFYNCTALTSVIVKGNNLTTIGFEAFEYDEMLEEVRLGSGVTTIGRDAFYQCEKLTALPLYEGITSIGDNAFSYTGAKSVVLPASVTSWGEYVFYSCEELRSVTLPAAMSGIPDYFFCGCENLSSIDLPNTITSIGDNAFYGCKNIHFFTLPTSLECIGTCAFSDCTGLTAIDCPATLRTIGYSAFSGCENLTAITLREGLEEIQYSAFSGTNLRAVELPASLTTLGNYAFKIYGGKLPERVYFEGAKPEAGGTVFNTATLLYVHPELIGWKEDDVLIETFAGGTVVSYYAPIVPAEFANLGISAGGSDGLSFAIEARGGCTLFTEDLPAWITAELNDGVITLSLSANTSGATRQYTLSIIGADSNKYAVTTITQGFEEQFTYSYDDVHDTALVTGYTGSDTAISIPSRTIHDEKTYAVVGIAAEAFQNGSLTSVILPASIKSIGNSAFNGCGSLENVAFPSGTLDSVGEYAFQNCAQLTSICLSATEIGQYAFKGCSALDIVTLLDGTHHIGDYAFDDSAVSSLELPECVETIGDYAFSNCNKLTAITLPASLTSLGAYAFEYCTQLLTADLSATALTVVPDAAFMKCSCLTTVRLPAGITSINDNAFYDCEVLANITLPDGLGSIGESSFRYASDLKSINLPEGMTTIGAYAFAATGLTSIHLPSTLNTWSGDYAFAHCDNLASVTTANGLSTIGQYAFYGCSKLSELQLADSIGTIKPYAFAQCNKLTSFTCPANLRTIESNVFRECTKLSEVVLHENIGTIQEYAFGDCEKLSSIDLSGVTAIGANAFTDCSALTTIALNDNATLGTYAFSNTGLTRVSLPNGVILTDATYLFYECKKLSEVTLAYGITSLPQYIFGECSSLRSIIIPETVMALNPHAFASCSNLTSVLFDGPKPTTFSSDVFYYSPNVVLQVYDREGYNWTIGASGSSVGGASNVIERLLAAPVIAPASTTFVDSLEISISDTDEGTLRYALNGALTADSPAYTAPFEITATTRISAALFDASGNRLSNIADATYTMTRGDAWRRIGSGIFEYTMPNGEPIVLENAGDYLWALQSETTYNSNQALLAGDSEATSPYVLSTTFSGKGILSFTWMKDTASSYATFQCVVDGDEENALALTGTANEWATSTVAILEDGDHEVRWIFTPYYSTNQCWLDNIVWTEAAVDVTGGETTVAGDAAADKMLTIDATDDWTVSVAEGGDWLAVTSPETMQEAGEGEIHFSVTANYNHSPRTGKIRITLHNDAFLETEVFQDLVITQSPIKLLVTMAIDPADSCDVTIKADEWTGNKAIALPAEGLELPYGERYLLYFAPKSGFSVAQLDGAAFSGNQSSFYVEDNREDPNANAHTLALEETVLITFQQESGTPNAYVQTSSTPAVNGNQYSFAPGQTVDLYTQGGVYDYRLDYWTLGDDTLELDHGRFIVTSEMNGNVLTPHFVKTVVVNLQCLLQAEEGLSEVDESTVAEDVTGTGQIDADRGTAVGLTPKQGYILMGWNTAASLEGMTQGGDYYVGDFDWDNAKSVTVYAIFATSATFTLTEDTEPGMGTVKVYVGTSEEPSELEFASGVELPVGTQLRLVAEGHAPASQFKQWSVCLGDQPYSTTSTVNPLIITLQPGANRVYVSFEGLTEYSFTRRGDIVPEGYTSYGFYNGDEKLADNGYLPVGTKVTLKAVNLPSGYGIKWYKGQELLSEGISCDVTLLESVIPNAFYAEFNGVWTLNGVVDPSYAGTISPATQEKPVGTEASITLTPADNWELDHWSDDSQNTSLTRAITSPNMPSEVTVTAVIGGRRLSDRDSRRPGKCRCGR